VVPVVDRGVRRQEAEPDEVEQAPLARVVQREAPSVIHQAHVGPAVQEHGGVGFAALEVLHGAHERSEPVRVEHVEGGALVEQQGDHVWVGALRRVVQRRLVLRVPRVGPVQGDDTAGQVQEPQPRAVVQGLEPRFRVVGLVGRHPALRTGRERAAWAVCKRDGKHEKKSETQQPRGGTHPVAAEGLDGLKQVSELVVPAPRHEVRKRAVLAVERGEVHVDGPAAAQQQQRGGGVPSGGRPVPRRRPGPRVRHDLL